MTRRPSAFQLSASPLAGRRPLTVVGHWRLLPASTAGNRGDPMVALRYR